MEYHVNIETCWIAGLWAADRGSLAKGVVSINNSNKALIDTFIETSLNNFDINASKIRKRVIQGYGTSNEAYFTRLPARKFIESIVINRSNLLRQNKLAFLAGRLDGDGTVNVKSSSLCYYYGLKELEELKIDEGLIRSLGFIPSTSTCGKKALRISVLKPRFFGSEVLQFIRHPEKKAKVELLIQKRYYGAQRTRPAPYVANLKGCTHRGLPALSGRKERSTTGPYGLNPLGYTRHTMVGIMGCNTEILSGLKSLSLLKTIEVKPILKPNLGSD